MNLKRLVGSTFLFAAIPLFANGCGAADDLCCTDFEVGADLSNVDFKIEGEAGAQYKVLAQASADLSAAVSGAVADVTLACRNIASDLGATSAELGEIDKKERNDQITAMCNLASAKITAGLTLEGGAKASLKIDFQAPKCEASVSAKANCQANCSVEGKCDIKANPPTCSGGKMTVSCSGGCEAEVKGEAFSCKGSCDVTASGSCTAQGGVECEGKCEGTCKGSAEGGTGEGVQADGTCKGTCEGSCSVTKPGVKCEGNFDGQCKGSCTPPSASVKVECDAKCAVEAEPLKCEGGSIEGGCKVDAKCDANCDASVSAKASCTPPSLAITIAGSVDGKAQAQVGAVIDTLKVNLPQILVVLKARGQAFVDLTRTIAGSASGSVSGDLGVKGTACLIPIAEALVEAGKSIPIALQASATVTASAGVK